MTRTTDASPVLVCDNPTPHPPHYACAGRTEAKLAAPEARAALKPGDRGALLRRAEHWPLENPKYIDDTRDLIRNLAAALREPQPQAPSACQHRFRHDPDNTCADCGIPLPPSAADDAVVEGLVRDLQGFRQMAEESEDGVARELLEIADRAIAALRSRRKT